MRWKPAVLVMACLVVCLVPGVAGAKPPTPKPKPTYYLALGDSLAQGVQPNAAGKSVETNHGYADFLYATEKPLIKGLKLVKYGCPGESTSSMINGGPFCKDRPYRGTQLAAAIRFIATHKIAFITLDIGANDVDGCARYSGAQLFACIGTGTATIKTNVPKIVKALRQAAGAKVKIAGMTYYDPFLAYYFGDASHKALAQPSVALTKGINDGLISDFQAQRIKVADVATAFDTYTPFTTTTTLRGHGTVPLAVAQICRLTWMCAAAPRGPNVHANTAGYKKIAGVFAAKL
jgi:lysophospholipase L1-like esterase